jgi:integrase
LSTCGRRHLTEAKRERESLLAGLREGRVAGKDDATFLAVFEEWQSSRTISARTAEHECYLRDQHLALLKGQKVQAITASDIARLLRRMREDGLSGWTAGAVSRIVKGVFGLAQRRGIVTSNPCEGLTRAERPKQKNKEKIERLDSATTSKLTAAATTERWKAGLGLTGLGALRLAEVRGLQWGDIDLAGNKISVERSLLPDGSAKATKTEAGERTLALFPELRRLLVAWKVKSPFTDPSD